MNKTQLIDTLAARFEGNRKAAAHALDSVLDTITREVAKGEKVAITGFGSFEKKVREARWVRNPQTGDRVETKRKSVPKFTPGADLKNVVSGAKKLTEAAADAGGAVVEVATAPARKAATVARSAAGGKKASSTKAPATKAPASKASATTATKAPAKKTSAKKTSTTPTTAKKSAAKSTATKAAAKTSTAKKAPAKKSTAKTTTAQKSTAKKSTAKKTTAKKSTAKKSG